MRFEHIALVGWTFLSGFGGETIPPAYKIYKAEISLGSSRNGTPFGLESFQGSVFQIWLWECGFLLGRLKLGLLYLQSHPDGKRDAS